jgi:hypothetical protein
MRPNLLLLTLPLTHALPRLTLPNTSFPDPSITYDPQTAAWYAFATNSPSTNVQAATAPFPHGPWTFLPNTDLLPDPGPWTHPSSPSLWAPSVHHLPATGSFVLYYSAALPAPHETRHCIGAATAPNITGPYTPLPTPFICPVDEGGAIDAAGYRDEADGAAWVLYKVDGSAKGPGGPCGNGIPGERAPTPIVIQKVDGRDGVTKIGEGVVVLERAADGKEGGLVEAPSLVFVGGRFVLFYSSHCFNTDGYDVRYAVAERVEGPYVKGGRLLGTGDFGLVRPGGATAVVGGGVLVFHAECEAGRCMYETEYVVEGGAVRIV